MVASFVPPTAAHPAGELPLAPLAWGAGLTTSLVPPIDSNGGLHVPRLDGLDLE